MSWTPCPDAAESSDGRAAVETVIVPRAVDLGEMVVRRALPSVARQMVGPFIFFDQMGPADFPSGHGIDVRPHPHINLATVTYLLHGEILHRDSLGTKQAIRPGAVNWMRAGRGIVHSERTGPDQLAAGQHLLGLQTWLALPEALEEAEPEFTHYPEADIPKGDADGQTLTVIAGALCGLESPVRTASATLYADLGLDAGSQAQIEATYEERAIYVLNGRIEVESGVYDSGTLLVLARGRKTVVKALEGARMMVFGGEPMEGPRYIWWNFVSSRPERIEQAKRDWQSGVFPIVPDDTDEFIPLPQDNTKPRRAVGGRSFS